MVQGNPEDPDGGAGGYPVPPDDHSAGFLADDDWGDDDDDDDDAPPDGMPRAGDVEPPEIFDEICMTPSEKPQFIYSVDDSATFRMKALRLMEGQWAGRDTAWFSYQVNRHWNLQAATLEVERIVKEHATGYDVITTGTAAHERQIAVSFGSMVVLMIGISSNLKYSNHNATTPELQTLRFDFSGEPALAATITDAVKEAFPLDRETYIDWWYVVDGRTRRNQFMLMEQPPIQDALYPFIEEGASAYMRRYFESSATILIAIGPPGTGKTTLIRSAIFANERNAMVTHEEKVLATDNMFVTFMTENDKNTIVVEDADLMLRSRMDGGGGKLVSRFLNISDGLIKLQSKKIIFTTNLSEAADIDPALVRPGRCFDVLRFRALHHGEAVMAANSAGLQAPEEDREYTLAELFNRRPIIAPTRKIGF